MKKWINGMDEGERERGGESKQETNKRMVMIILSSDAFRNDSGQTK